MSWRAGAEELEQRRMLVRRMGVPDKVALTWLPASGRCVNVLRNHWTPNRSLGRPAGGARRHQRAARSAALTLRTAKSFGVEEIVGPRETHRCRAGSPNGRRMCSSQSPRLCHTGPEST